MKKIYLSIFLTCLVASVFATKITVTVNFNNFSPNAVNANVNDTIRWVLGAGTHTTTSATVPNGAATWNAPIDNANQSFEYRITVAGNYTYVCTPHGFSGTINAVNACPAQAVGSSLNCFGDCTGIASVFPGGQAPHTYSWNTNPVQTTAIASNLCAGTYTVTVTDANGCVATASANVTQPPAIIVVSSQTNVTCNGLCNGTATVNPQGGVAPYAYSWNTNPIQGTATATGLCARTYICTIKDANGCIVTHTVVITQPNALSLNISGNDVQCNGACNGFATTTVQGGTAPFTYSWNTNPIQTSPTAQALCAGTYVCTVTDANGCVISNQVVITQPNSAIVLTTNSTPASCGGSNGSATVLAQGGVPPYTYSWNTNPIQTTATATNIPAGVYTITVTDANGCIQTANVTVTNPNAPNAQIVQVINASCNGVCNGQAFGIANGGMAPYTYSWSNGVNTQANNNLCAGTYILTVTDAGGCVGTAQVTITENATIVITSTQNNPTCNNSCNGDATVNPAGGAQPYSYSWNTNPVQTTQTATGLCAGVYICTVTDANGCMQVHTVNIVAPNQLMSNVTQQNASCNGVCNGMASVVLTGGTPAYSYSWNTNPPQNTATATGLCAGTYVCAYTDANNCQGSVTVIITNMSNIVVNPTLSHPTCTGCTDGSATATPTGGNAPYAYSWNTNPVQTTQTINNLVQGTYIVCVTDAGSCTVCDTVVLVDIPFSVEEISSLDKVKIFPNPSTGVFAISLLDTKQVKLICTNMLGEVVYSETVVNTSSKQIDLSKVAKGIYNLQIVNATASKTFKVVIE